MDKKKLYVFYTELCVSRYFIDTFIIFNIFSAFNKQDAEICSLVISIHIVFYAITSRFSMVKFPAERNNSRVQRERLRCVCVLMH